VTGLTGTTCQPPEERRREAGLGRVGRKAGQAARGGERRGGRRVGCGPDGEGKGVWGLVSFFSFSNLFLNNFSNPFLNQTFYTFFTTFSQIIFKDF
jgi:hypothetical protein